MKKFIKRATTGVFALAFLAGSYPASGSYQTEQFKAAAAEEETIVPGDVNCDGVVDIKDVKDISKYLKDPEKNPLSAQGMKNADMAHYNGSSYNSAHPELKGIPDYNDAVNIVEALGGVNGFSTTGFSSDTFKDNIVEGDADADGDVDVYDAVALYNYLKYPKKYPLTDQGRKNANAAHSNGSSYTNELDSNDYRNITEYIAGVASQGLGTTKVVFNLKDNMFNLDDADIDLQEPIYGDFNCDGEVDIIDAVELNDFINKADTINGQVYNLTQDLNISLQSIINGNVYNPGLYSANDRDRSIGLTKEDAEYITKYITGETLLPVYSDDYVSYEPKPGDFNCDNVFNIRDAVMLYEYIEGISVEAEMNGEEANLYKPSEQGKVNADTVNRGSGLDYDDLEHMLSELKAGSEKAALVEKVTVSETPAEETVTETTAPISTIPTAITNTSSSNSAELQVTLAGDANCDGKVDMADAVLIMQAISNPSRFGIGGTDEHALTEQGRINADVDTDSKGLTSKDALKIQKFLLGIIKSF